MENKEINFKETAIIYLTVTIQIEPMLVSLA